MWSMKVELYKVYLAILNVHLKFAVINVNVILDQ